MQNRIVLYRDHPPQYLDMDIGNGSRGVKVRYAEIMKKGGKVISIRVEANVFPFVIETVRSLSLSFRYYEWWID